MALFAVATCPLGTPPADEVSFPTKVSILRFLVTTLTALLTESVVLHVVDDVPITVVIVPVLWTRTLVTVARAFYGEHHQFRSGLFLSCVSNSTVVLVLKPLI